MIYWSEFERGEWIVTLAATEKGLCYVSLADDGEQQMKEWTRRHFSDSEYIYCTEVLADYAKMIEQYLSGGPVDFSSLPLDLKSTSFQKTVWEELHRIPYGKTVNYSDIAGRIGSPSAVRAVASAIGRNPVLLVIPCHRVIGKNGALSGYRDGKELKKRLLAMENKM